MNETSAASEITPVPQSNQGAGIFGTKVPSAVTFGVGVLLFFMPFLDIKCNSMVLQKVSGVQLATGFKVKSPGSENSLVGGLENMNQGEKHQRLKKEKRDPNIIALVALCLGVTAFLLSLANLKTGGLIAGVLTVVALVATMIDVKSQLNSELYDPGLVGTNSLQGDRNLGDDFLIAVDFTPWFYIAVITFGVAAFFCFKWLRGK